MLSKSYWSFGWARLAFGPAWSLSRSPEKSPNYEISLYQNYGRFEALTPYSTFAMKEVNHYRGICVETITTEGFKNVFTYEKESSIK